MSWRFLTLFLVLCMGGAALAGMVVGNWLVNEAPVIDEGTRTNIGHNSEQVLDASGRPLAAIAPQPLTDGTLGMPRESIQPMWEIQPVSLFDANLDPMVTLAIGSQGFTIGDVLSQAGAGLGQGASDVATLDVTQGNTAGDPINQLAQNSQGTSKPAASASGADNWSDALDRAIRACESVGFFSRPGCIEQARQRFCGPNNAWGKHRHCPMPQAPGTLGGGA